MSEMRAEDGTPPARLRLFGQVRKLRWGFGLRPGGGAPAGYGVPASKRAFAGSVWTLGVPSGSTQGHGRLPKNAGFPSK
jgi:hypothetical protein